MSYLTRTLVPDLKDSGKTETAKDFLKVVSLLKSGKRDRKFEQYLERTLIPDLKDSGLVATSEDFEIGLYLMQKSDESLEGSDRESDGGVEETTKFPTEHDIAFAEQVMNHIRERGRSNISSISQALNVEPDRLAGVMDRMKREDILLDLGGGMVSLPEKEPEPERDNIDPATSKVVGSEVTTNESLDEMRLGDLFRGFYKKLQKGRKVKPDPQIAEILHADVTKPMSLKGMTQDQIKILAKHLRGDYRESQTTQVSFARSDAPDFLRIARAVGISESTPLTVTGDRFVLEAPSVLAFMLDEEEVECLA